MLPTTSTGMSACRNVNASPIKRVGKNERPTRGQQPTCMSRLHTLNIVDGIATNLGRNPTQQKRDDGSSEIEVVWLAAQQYIGPDADEQ